MLYQLFIENRKYVISEVHKLDSFRLRQLLTAFKNIVFCFPYCKTALITYHLNAFLSFNCMKNNQVNSNLSSQPEPPNHNEIRKKKQHEHINNNRPRVTS